MIGRWVRQQVACQLLNGKLVVWHIVVQRFYDPIAVLPHRPAHIFFIPLGVRISSLVQPPTGPFFTVSISGQQLVYNIFIGNFARGKILKYGLVWRKSADIHGKPSRYYVRFSSWTWFQIIIIQGPQYKVVNFIFNKSFRIIGRNTGRLCCFRNFYFFR